MPRVHTQKANKDYPSVGVVKGQTYYKWKFRFGPLVRSATYPKASQLTRSEFLGQVYDFQDRLEAITEDELKEGVLEEIASEMEDLGSEQEEKQQNMPDSLQYSPTGELLEGRAASMSEWADNLNGVDVPQEVDEPDDEPTEPDEPDEDDFLIPDIEGRTVDTDAMAAAQATYESEMNDYENEMAEFQNASDEYDTYETDLSNALEEAQGFASYEGE
jgi:hypothetical protein